MSHELQKIENQIKHLNTFVGDLQNKVNDSATYHFSTGSISSIAEDRTTCKVFLDDKSRILEGVRSAIRCTQLNTISHLREGDYVLVMYKYPSFGDPIIILTLQPSNTSYVSDKAMLRTSRAAAFFGAQGV